MKTLQLNKNSAPKQSVIFATYIILKLLKRKRVSSVAHIISDLENKIEGGSFLFTPAISLLFLLGYIEYYQTTDTIVIKK